MTKGARNDTVDEASLKAVSKYLEGRELNFVSIPLLEKLLSMEGDSGPSRKNDEVRQLKGKTPASGGSTGGEAEAGKKSTKVASTNQSSGEDRKTDHLGNKCGAGIVNLAFQSSDLMEDSAMSVASREPAIDSSVIADSKEGEGEPRVAANCPANDEVKVERSDHERLTVNSGSERRETCDVKPKPQEDCVTQGANVESDGNPSVKPAAEGSNNDAGHDGKRRHGKDSKEKVSTEGVGVAHIDDKQVSSDESDAEAEDDDSKAGAVGEGKPPAGPSSGRKILVRRAWIHTGKSAPRRGADRVRRKNSRRNIRGGRLRYERATVEVLGEEFILEKFQVERRPGFLERVLSGPLKASMQAPLPGGSGHNGRDQPSGSTVAGSSVTVGNSAQNTRTEGARAQAAVRAEADQNTQPERDAGESNNEGAQVEETHQGGADDVEMEDEEAHEGNREEEVRAKNSPREVDIAQRDSQKDATERREESDNPASEDFQTGDDWQTTDGFQTADDDVSESDSVGTHGDDFYDCEDTVSGNENAEPVTSQRIVCQYQDVLAGADDYDGDDSDGSIADSRGNPCSADVDGDRMSVEDTIMEKTVVETAVSKLVTETSKIPSIAVDKEQVALPLDTDDDIANSSAVSDEIPRTSSPVGEAASVELSAEKDLAETESSQGFRCSTPAGNNERAAEPEASSVKQVDVQNVAPKAAKNEVLNELENLVQVLKNYRDPSVRQAMRDFAVERTREYCLIRRKNILMNAIAMSSKKTTRVLLQMLKEHLLRIKYMVHNEQENSLPISEEVCVLVWDLPLTEFAKLEEIVDTIAVHFDSPIAKIKTVADVLKRVDYELSTGQLQRRFQQELMNALRRQNSNP